MADVNNARNTMQIAHTDTMPGLLSDEHTKRMTYTIDTTLTDFDRYFDTYTHKLNGTIWQIFQTLT